MNVLNRLALAALATTLPTASTLASDLITVPTGSTIQMPVHEEPGFAWSGFYAGVYGIGQNDASAGLGVQAGINAQFDFYLIGAEVAVQGLAGANVGNTSYGEILGRAGLIVSDNVLVYAAGGYGIDLGPPDASDALVGAGVELAVTDGLSVEAQYLHGFSLEGGNGTDQVTFGANFHF